MAEKLNEAREIAFGLLMRAAHIDGGWLDPMSSTTLEDACEYFNEIGWLRRDDDKPSLFVPMPKDNREGA